jgi:ubiquinone/menaquinone biosynthesis C-methylase UbiE
MKERKMLDWWQPEDQGGFFGDTYRLGDDSEEGPYEKKHMTLSERTTREVDFIWNFLGVRPSTHLLDCPCGYGRHSLELARRGARVTGVDINERFLTHARDEMARTNVPASNLKLVSGDMRNLPLGAESVDGVINMFTSFGFFEKDEENKKVIEEYARVLKKGGSLLIHLDYNPIKVADGEWYDENNQRTLKNGAHLIVNDKYNSWTKRISGCWTLVNPDPGVPDKTLCYSLRVYSQQEYREMLTECGFTDIRILGNLEEPTKELNKFSLETAIKAIKR